MLVCGAGLEGASIPRDYVQTDRKANTNRPHESARAAVNRQHSTPPASERVGTDAPSESLNVRIGSHT